MIDFYLDTLARNEKDITARLTQVADEQINSLSDQSAKKMGIDEKFKWLSDYYEKETDPFRQDPSMVEFTDAVHGVMEGTCQSYRPDDCPKY